MLAVQQKYLVLLILKEFLELYDVALGETGRPQTLEQLEVLELQIFVWSISLNAG